MLLHDCGLIAGRAGGGRALRPIAPKSDRFSVARGDKGERARRGPRAWRPTTTGSRPSPPAASRRRRRPRVPTDAELAAEVWKGLAWDETTSEVWWKGESGVGTKPCSEGGDVSLDLAPSLDDDDDAASLPPPDDAEDVYMGLKEAKPWRCQRRGAAWCWTTRPTAATCASPASAATAPWASSPLTRTSRARAAATARRASSRGATRAASPSTTPRASPSTATTPAARPTRCTTTPRSSSAPFPRASSAW